jgi:ATP-dependent RNA helicase DeaD
MTALPEGAAAPPPTFDALPLSPEVRRALDVMGYKHPTPVQLAVYEPASRGASLVVQARTGTGKTAAFGLPLLDTLVKRSLPKVQALILTPTRELALQISRELEKIAQFRDVKVTAIYGGASMVKQVEALEGGAQIVAGTPGRVLDHIRRGTLDTKAIKIFVLDEADEMLSMGFAKELSAIADSLPQERQGLFFSATIPPDVERLAAAKLKDPEFITLSSDQVGALEINHFVYIVRGGDKRQQIVRVLETEDPESAIIFCNTKEETERLTAVLLDKGYDAEWLNGDLAQNERERIMARTREGKLRFLVATDVAARGIDISHLTHVINADFPETAEYYVHRTGRTGRAGRTGTAISMVGPKDIGSLYLLRLTYKIRPIEKQLPTDGEIKTRSELDIVQLFEEAFGARVAHPDDLALARRLMTHADSEKIIAGLLRDHLGARPGDPKTEAADARRAKNPEPIAAPVAEPVVSPPPRGPSMPRPLRNTPTRGRREPAKRGSPHTDYVTWEPPTESDDNKPILTASDLDPPVPRFTVSDAPASEAEDPSVSQIFVNVGRRDGANAVDIQKLLEDRAGISRDETAQIRVRDRNTFLTVKRELVEKAIAALVGQVIGGRTLVAEVARPRT